MIDGVRIGRGHVKDHGGVTKADKKHSGKTRALSLIATTSCVKLETKCK
jgi:hypothetical protein